MSPEQKNKEQEELRQEIDPIIVRSEELQVIKSDQDFSDAGKMLVTIKQLRKKVKEEFGPIVDKAYQAHKAAKALQNKYEEPLKTAEGVLKPAIGSYSAELRRREDEQRRKAEEEARKQAETERLEQAEALEKAGETKVAEAILEAPVVVAKVTVPETKAEGISTRKKWKAEITDMATFVKACVKEEGQANISLLLADTKALDAMAKGLGVNMKIPGVRATEEIIVAVRT